MSTSASAQTLTQVSGTITDPNGLKYTNALLTIQLTGGGSTPQTTPCAVSPCNVTNPPVIQTDNTGTFHTALWANGSITPGGTQWSFFVTEPGIPLPGGTGAQSFTYTVTITGSSQSLSSGMSALAPALSNITGGTATPCLSAFALQYDNFGAFGCDAALTYTPASNLLAASAAGVFTNTTFNSYNSFSLCSSATPQSIFHAAGSTYNLTDSVDGCVQVPASNATNGFSVGLAGWAEVDNSCTTCSALGTAQAAVGTVGSCYAFANNANCYGGDFAANDKAGNTGNILRPVEIDSSIFSTSSSGAMLTLAMQGSAQPTGDNFPAIFLSAVTGSLFTTGLECAQGTINTSSSTFGACLYSEPETSANNVPSYLLLFGSRTSGGTLVQRGLQLTAGGELQTGAYLSGAVLANDVGTQTISGCSLSAASGGAGAGKFTAGATSCTVTITPGFTAADGFQCYARDTTTPADTLAQSGNSTSTCELTGTVASSDIINWFVVGY